MQHIVRILARSALVIVTLLSFGADEVLAGPPELQTSAPVIYLADNLDEQDNLGWCIDTVGRGFSERLHAHSCKPQGGDVQFTYDEPSQQIRSATFANKCATLNDAAAAGVRFGLIDCSPSNGAQQFTFNREAGEFRPTGRADLCLTVGTSSRSAGPFMSRNLQLAACSTTEAKLKSWRIKR